MKWTFRRFASISVAAGLMASSAAQAQYDGALMADYGSAMMAVGLNAMNTNMLLGAMSSVAANRSSESAAARKTDAAASIRISYQADTTGTTIAQMVSVYPVQQRSKVAGNFRELLKAYSSIEKKFGIPPHDLAGAIAAFLAGSYMAYRDVDFPDENFKPLVSQMRQAISTNPALLKATNAEKQAAYDQMAILGMFMAVTQMALREQPNAKTSAGARRAAKSYLEQFLKTDADKVQITPSGLIIR